MADCNRWMLHAKEGAKALHEAFDRFGALGEMLEAT